MRSKRVERESLLKSFSLFFFSLSTLLGLLFYGLYLKELDSLERTLFSKMRLCSLELKCPEFRIDFAPKKGEEPLLIHHVPEGLYALFPLPGSEKYYLKILYPQKSYRRAVVKIARRMLWGYVGLEVVVALLSLLFSLYALQPLRRALTLTEEFSKDILHDFNTPLSIVRLNARMLAKECADNRKLTRIEEAVETLMRLQKNLRAYLNDQVSRQESFDLAALVQARVALFAKEWPHLRFVTELAPLEVKTHKEAMERVLDNLLSNAAKYNRSGGEVVVTLQADPPRLAVIDTGIGISHPDKVFDRFYKEHERGLGIGLNIVKKLCAEMGVGVRVESRVGEGSRFTLDLRRIAR